MGKKVTTNFIIMKVVPIFIGFLVWTNFKGIFYNFVINLPLFGVFQITGPWFLTFFVFLLYGIVIWAILKTPGILEYLIKTVFWPIYLTWKILSWNMWGTLLGLIIILLCNLFMWVFIFFVVNDYLLRLSSVVLPLLAILNIFWFFYWTFDPFKIFFVMKKKKERYYKNLQSQIEDLKNKKEELGKKGERMELLTHNVFVHLLEWKIRFFKQVEYTHVLVGLFSFMFLFIVAITTISFSFSYFCLLKIDPANLGFWGSEIGLIDLTLFSLKNMFFGDYGRIWVQGNWASYYVLVQSFCGLGFLTLLILSFSVITTPYGEKTFERIKDELGEFSKELEHCKINNISKNKNSE